MPNDELVLPAADLTHRRIVVVDVALLGRQPFRWAIWDKIEARPLQSSYARFRSVRAAFQAGSEALSKRWGSVQHPVEAKMLIKAGPFRTPSLCDASHNDQNVKYRPAVRD